MAARAEDVIDAYLGREIQARVYHDYTPSEGIGPAV